MAADNVGVNHQNDEEIYREEREFVPGSRLHAYLVQKLPDEIGIKERKSNFLKVLTMMKKIITVERLFDPRNPAIIICGPELEEALDVRALHVSDIKLYVGKQFLPTARPVPPITVPPPATGPLMAGLPATGRILPVRFPGFSASTFRPILPAPARPTPTILKPTLITPSLFPLKTGFARLNNAPNQNATPNVSATSNTPEWRAIMPHLLTASKASAEMTKSLETIIKILGPTNGGNPPGRPVLVSRTGLPIKLEGLPQIRPARPPPQFVTPAQLQKTLNNLPRTCFPTPRTTSQLTGIPISPVRPFLVNGSFGVPIQKFSNPRTNPDSVPIPTVCKLEAPDNTTRDSRKRSQTNQKYDTWLTKRTAYSRYSFRSSPKRIEEGFLGNPDRVQTFVQLPGWACQEPDDTNPPPQPTQTLDNSDRCIPKPGFRAVLMATGDPRANQETLQLAEVGNMLSKYIMARKDTLFDLRNIRICFTDELLEKAFHVKAFDRSQIPQMMRNEVTKCDSNQ